MGFTQSQANLYLTLLKTGQADAKTLSKNSKVPRQAVYRVLQELQEMSCVEKVIAAPYEFKPVPVCDCLSCLITKRAEEYKSLAEKAKALLQLLESSKDEVSSEKEPRFIMVQGKERIVQLYKSKHDSAQMSVDIISNGHRWLQILQYCFENYRKALERGVLYRVIVDQPGNENGFLGKVQGLLANPNFKLGLSNSIKTNAAVFDGKDVNFNFYPAKMLGESPVISTNHPSIIAMFQSHFETNWKSAKKNEGKSPKKGKGRG